MSTKPKTLVDPFSLYNAAMIKDKRTSKLEGEKARDCQALCLVMAPSNAKAWKDDECITKVTQWVN